MQWEQRPAKDELMRMHIRPAEQGLNGLMQLAQRGIAANENASPEVGACATQNDMELICANRLIRLAHVAQDSSRPDHSGRVSRPAPVLLEIRFHALESKKAGAAAIT